MRWQLKRNLDRNKFHDSIGGNQSRFEFALLVINQHFEIENELHFPKRISHDNFTAIIIRFFVKIKEKNKVWMFSYRESQS